MELNEADFQTLIDEKLFCWRRISVGIVNCAADADDAVLRALGKAWLRRHALKDGSAAAAWIARIVVNESYNIVRKRLREKENNVGLPELAAGSPGRNPELDKLDAGIARLPELYRDAIQVAVLGELDSDDAAQILGCSVNTLYQRIHKAKRLLKEMMGEMNYE